MKLIYFIIIKIIIFFSLIDVKYIDVKYIIILLNTYNIIMYIMYISVLIL